MIQPATGTPSAHPTPAAGHAGRAPAAAPSTARSPGREDGATLSDVGRRLGELHTALGRVRAALGSAKANGIAAARGELDAAASDLARAGRGEGVEAKLSPWVTEAHFFDSTLEPGERLALRLQVLEPPERGELLITTTWPGRPDGEVNLFAGSAFSVEITGNLGTRALSFASSQTLGQVAAAINHFAAETGVRAELRDGVIALHSSEYGSGEFISVRTTDGESNLSYINPSGDPPTTYVHADSPRDDFGADLQALLNGEPVEAYGTRLSFVTPQVSGMLTLSEGLFEQQEGAPPGLIAAFLRGASG